MFFLEYVLIGLDGVLIVVVLDWFIIVDVIVKKGLKVIIEIYYNSLNFKF